MSLWANERYPLKEHLCFGYLFVATFGNASRTPELQFRPEVADP